MRKKSIIGCLSQFSNIYSYHPLNFTGHTPTHSKSGPRKHPGNTKEESVALGRKRTLDKQNGVRDKALQMNTQIEVERIKG